MAQPVVHFEVVGKDGDALRKYYGELFGWEFSDPMGPTDYTVLTNADGIGGGIGNSPDGYSGHLTFYVQVDDAEEALSQAERLGGTRMVGPDEVPGAGITIGLLQDPEGHTVGVMSQSAGS